MSYAIGKWQIQQVKFIDSKIKNISHIFLVFNEFYIIFISKGFGWVTIKLKIKWIKDNLREHKRYKVKILLNETEVYFTEEFQESVSIYNLRSEKLAKIEFQVCERYIVNRDEMSYGYNPLNSVNGTVDYFMTYTDHHVHYQCRSSDNRNLHDCKEFASMKIDVIWQDERKEVKPQTPKNPM